MKHNNRVKSAAVLAGLGLLLLATAVALKGSFGNKTPASSKPESLPVAAVPQSSPAPTVALPREYRAVWISYLEYQQMDFSSEEAFVAEISAMMDNVKAAGCTRVLMQVRACGDALYASEIFPWSHFITGTQGRDPGYDPLAIMLREAHNRGLALEAWVNPYRVRIGASQPELLAPENPAQRYLNSAETEDWVQQVEDGGLWYNPGVPEVRQLIVDGVAELCRNYELDGVQFDDYFYPTTDSAFDETSYATTGKDLLLDDWRRDNVNALVKAVYATVKSINPTMTFGISPQGNSSNNYNMQYSDVALWMKQPGYVDYICPQLYWGFDYRTAEGSDRFAFENCARSWLEQPRDEGVKLYLGLGAYRIGAGDGSFAASDEWQSGENLAQMVTALRRYGADGYAVYRYDNLWNSSEPLAAQETAALAAVNQ